MVNKMITLKARRVFPPSFPVQTVVRRIFLRLGSQQFTYGENKIDLMSELLQNTPKFQRNNSVLSTFHTNPARGGFLSRSQEKVSQTEPKQLSNITRVI